MNDTLKTLAARVADLLGPGKPFANASALAKRAHTMGLVTNAQHFARSIHRVMTGEVDVQISTIDIIARAANVRVSDLLDNDPGKSSAESVKAFEEAIRPERQRAESLSQLVELLLAELDKTRADRYVTIDAARDLLSNRPFGELLELAGGIDALQPEEVIALWHDVARTYDAPLSTLGRLLSMALASQKAIDTPSSRSDPSDNLINQTRGAASAVASTERSEGTEANGTSRRGPSDKRH